MLSVPDRRPWLDTYAYDCCPGGLLVDGNDSQICGQTDTHKDTEKERETGGGGRGLPI